MLAKESTIPLYILSLFPENFISTPSPFSTNGANISGTSTSINKKDASSISSTTELSETFISSEKFLLPITPSNGAVIVLFFNLATTSPDLTLVLYLISSRISYFSMLYDCVPVSYTHLRAHET